VLLVLRSGATKIGLIACTYVSRLACPVHCSLKRQGCYANCSLQIESAWNRADREGLTIWELTRKLDDLPDGAMLRWAVAGDLPGDGHRINLVELDALARSVKRLKAWTYTHYLTPPQGVSVREHLEGNLAWSPGPHNIAAIESAQAAGFTINLSADDPRQADELSELELAPVATVLPRNARGRITTPAGRPILVCPASSNEKVNCSSCGFCLRREPGRKIVGFPAHGLLWPTVDARVRASA